MSFLLDGDKMRQRLSQILAQAENTEVEEQEQHNANQIDISQASAFE